MSSLISVLSSEISNLAIEENSFSETDSIHSVDSDNIHFDVFTPFPQLVFELRNKIWRQALPPPRVVDIVYDEQQDRYFSFHAEIPAILHVCFESRALALQDYDISFGTKTHPATIPFDFRRDCFMFDDWLAGTYYRPGRSLIAELDYLIGPMSSRDMNSIRRVAIPHTFVNGRGTSVSASKCLAKKSPGMNYLVACFEEEHDSYKSAPITFLRLSYENRLVQEWTRDRKSAVALADQDSNADSATNKGEEYFEPSKNLPKPRDRGNLRIHFRIVCRAGENRSICSEYRLTRDQKNADDLPTTDESLLFEEIFRDEMKPIINTPEAEYLKTPTRKEIHEYSGVYELGEGIYEYDEPYETEDEAYEEDSDVDLEIGLDEISDLQIESAIYSQNEAVHPEVEGGEGEK